MAEIERLGAADHAAVGRLPVEASSRRFTEWRITRARGQGALYERMGFVVDGDLPMNFGLRYWRFRLDL